MPVTNSPSFYIFFERESENDLDYIFLSSKKWLSSWKIVAQLDLDFFSLTNFFPTEWQCVSNGGMKFTSPTDHAHIFFRGNDSAVVMHLRCFGTMFLGFVGSGIVCRGLFIPVPCEWGGRSCLRRSKLHLNQCCTMSATSLEAPIRTHPTTYLHPPHTHTRMHAGIQARTHNPLSFLRLL